jgi:hypothetical protein
MVAACHRRGVRVLGHLTNADIGVDKETLGADGNGERQG